jgi:hypothetical protein
MAKEFFSGWLRRVIGTAEKGVKVFIFIFFSKRNDRGDESWEVFKIWGMF